ncbi:glycosyl hydrolase family 18 protein [Paractinoplanes durhamensis]|uniref:glycosyl hydrolase family 18 protein n=1 Tax=Paractinoplanes durhamensis TaxID=113563 RepID=UPI00362FB385
MDRDHQRRERPVRHRDRAGEGVFADGTEDYKTVKNLPGFQVYRDVRAGNSWLFDGTTFWTYDDPAQMLQKTLYIRAKGLGGAMMWSLDGDDDNASLTKTISSGLR